MGVQLPKSLRDKLIDELDDFLDAIAAPEVEQVVAYLLEQIELHGEDTGRDDLVAEMEEEGSLDGSLSETLETEMESNDEFEFTGEEIVTLLERIVGIDWDYDDDEEEEEEEEDDDEDDDF